MTSSDTGWDRWYASDPACWSWPIPPLRPPANWRIVPELQQYYDFHDGRCALCGGPRGDVEDHCHRSGLVRGELCRPCNRREGRHHGGIYQRYRERPPTVILGYAFRYEGGWLDDDPDPGVVELLGPVPQDGASAADYLTRCALIGDQRRRRDNPLRKMGL
jgi:hypothetical protein